MCITFERSVYLLIKWGLNESPNFGSKIIGPQINSMKLFSVILSLLLINGASSFSLHSSFAGKKLLNPSTSPQGDISSQHSTRWDWDLQINRR